MEEQQITSRLESAYRNEALDENREPDLERVMRRANREVKVRDVVTFGFSRLFQSFLVIFVRIYSTPRIDSSPTERSG